MADKVEKPKKSKAKPKKDEKGVLASLSSTRPQRIGTRRASAPGTPAKPAAAKPGAAKPTTGAKTSAAKPTTAAKTSAAKAPAAAAKTSAAKPAAAKPAAGAREPAAPRATATRRKAAAPRTFEPTHAAESAAGAAAPPPPEPEPRPRAVREGAPGMGTSERSREPSPEHGRPSGVELVTTAVQAAGELTQVGLKIGGQIVKRAVDRLPKP